MYSLWQYLYFFDLVTLTYKFDLLLKNFNLDHSFVTRRGRSFIFHICIPCSKTFNVVPWFWCSDLDLEGWPTFKKIVLDYDFWIRGVTYCCYLHMVPAGELCCLSDNSGFCNVIAQNETFISETSFFIHRWKMIKKMIKEKPIDFFVKCQDQSNKIF